MAEFELRPATEDDFPAIKALIHLVHINPTGLDWRRFLVAVGPQGEIVGCGQIKPQGSLRVLASIAVVPGWRKQGVARAIIERLLSEQTGALHLTCREHLGVFYERFGFSILEAADIPAEFRGMSRFVRLLRRLRIIDEVLLVMRRP
jgi:N-acetylglutamate synthase-like GNAT family acetyltransferase